MAKANKKFPKTILVQKEGDGPNNEYMVVYDSPESIYVDGDSAEDVAVYQLVRVTKVKSKIELL